MSEIIPVLIKRNFFLSILTTISVPPRCASEPENYTHSKPHKRTADYARYYDVVGER